MIDKFDKIYSSQKLLSLLDHPFFEFDIPFIIKIAGNLIEQ